MPATMEICENGRVLHFVFSSPLTLKEIKEAIAKDEDYRDTVSFTVHALVALTNTNVPPSSISARRSPSLVHPTSGYFVVIGADGLNRVITETILKVLQNKNVKFYDTEAEGRAFLKQILATENIQDTARSGSV